MDRMRRPPVAFFAVFVVVLALLPMETSGQSLSGSLVGTVRDSQGGVLLGAVVRVVSPALMGGEERTTSNDTGRWRFPVLPPGHYQLIVEDLGSKNGTYLNGVRIVTPQRLSHGDELRLGAMVVTFRITPPATPTETVTAPTVR